MEQKNNALKTASKVISVITKIGYTLMTVTMGISVAMLIFLAVTGGRTAMFTIGKTDIIVFDELATVASELAAKCAILVVMAGMFFAIFLLAYRMFNEISMTGEPFTEKYVKTVKAIGILIAAMPFALGITKCIVTIFIDTKIPDMFSDVPGIVVGAIVFCLSYIIEYGCDLNRQLAEDSKGEQGV